MVKPPKILESILTFFVEYDEQESLCGDFAETYALSQIGPVKHRRFAGIYFRFLN